MRKESRASLLHRQIRAVFFRDAETRRSGLSPAASQLDATCSCAPPPPPPARTPRTWLHEKHLPSSRATFVFSRCVDAQITGLHSSTCECVCALYQRLINQDARLIDCRVWSCGMTLGALGVFVLTEESLGSSLNRGCLVERHWEKNIFFLINATGNF